MKVLYVLDSVEKYGAADSFIQMVDSLNKIYDVEPVIITNSEGRIYNWAVKKGYICISAGHHAFLHDFGSSIFSKCFHFFLYPIIYISYKRGNYVALRTLSESVNFCDIDLVHTNVNRNDLGALLSKKYKLPHVWHLREFPPGFHFNLKSFRKNYINFMNLHTNVFISISNSVRKAWTSIGLDESKTITIPDGIIDESTPINNHAEKDKFRIVMMGYICREKGQEQLLDAVSKLPEDLRTNVTVDIYGDGALYSIYLKRKIKRSNISKNVFFKGYVCDANKELYKYHCGAVCSKNEGLGRATIEYMNSGCAVVACDTGANTEIIENEKTGLIYEYRNADDLCKCLKRLMTDNELRIKLGINAQQYAVKNFNCGDYSGKIYDLYKNILNS